jgi:hypothetical protein
LLHDVGDSVILSVNYALKKMSREDLIALRDSSLLVTKRIEQELNTRPDPE